MDDVLLTDEDVGIANAGGETEGLALEFDAICVHIQARMRLAFPQQ